MDKKKRIAWLGLAQFSIAIVILLSGCSMIAGIGDSILGTYMGGLEKARSKGKFKVFDDKIGDCFDKALIILGQMDAEIIKMDIHRYKIMAVVNREPLSEIDQAEVEKVNTADVGIFLTEISDGKTKVEVSSLSSPFVNYVSEILFSKLEGKN